MLAKKVNEFFWGVADYAELVGCPLEHQFDRAVRSECMVQSGEGVHFRPLNIDLKDVHVTNVSNKIIYSDSLNINLFLGIIEPF